MQAEFYTYIKEQSLSDSIITKENCLKILESDEIELIALLNSAFEIRKTFFGKDVLLHIINNVQNGYCSEDCQYCAQSKDSKAQIAKYPMKSDEEILTEAKEAYETGAFRYCMVLSGYSHSKDRIQHLADIVQRIKAQYKIEVCISAGVLDTEKTIVLKKAGLDRINHNLNTSEDNYPKICTTHNYKDRINTLKEAKTHGLQICSGVIIGMGESNENIIDMALTLNKFQADSIPINFFIPIEGSKLKENTRLSPEYCLRVLCLFRFLNPKAEIRIAAGREMYLRQMEAMALYPANSLFLGGYLNARGDENFKTIQMIKDAGFNIKSEKPIDSLLDNYKSNKLNYQEKQNYSLELKNIDELRPKHKLSNNQT